MKKALILASIALLILFAVAHFSYNSFPFYAHIAANQKAAEVVHLGGSDSGVNTHLAGEQKARNLDHKSSPLPNQNVALPQESSASAPGVKLSPRAAAISATPPQNAGRVLDDGGPSIGTVRVIGHRGCDVNTQGWYLGVGAPEQYDYSVSDDGESLTVQPKVPSLTGAFEFVHCVDAGQIAGKHIQFSVGLKAQDVSQLAQLRLWGENPAKDRILFKSEKIIGTYDWKNVSIEADVDPEVTLFNYGITFRSTGKLWINRPEFSVTP